jgi:hypothetical protein
MFEEDLDTFVEHFGSPAIYGSQTAMVLFDRPDAEILTQRVQSTQYRIEYPAEKFVGLKHGDVLLIGITPGWRFDAGGTRLVYEGSHPAPETGRFRTLGTPNRVDDGSFLEAHLERIE